MDLLDVFHHKCPMLRKEGSLLCPQCETIVAALVADASLLTEVIQNKVVADSANQVYDYEAKFNDTNQKPRLQEELEMHLQMELRRKGVAVASPYRCLRHFFDQVGPSCSKTRKHTDMFCQECSPWLLGKVSCDNRQEITDAVEYVLTQANTRDYEAITKRRTLDFYVEDAASTLLDALNQSADSEDEVIARVK